MEIWIFGNPDLAMDARPLAYLPALEKEFPQHRFVVRDPNEEWQLPEHLVIIDTVVGLDTVTVFHPPSQEAMALAMEECGCPP